MLNEKCFAPCAMSANVTMRDNKHAFICSSLGNLMDLVLLSYTLPDSAAWSMDEKWALIAAGCLGAWISSQTAKWRTQRMRRMSWVQPWQVSLPGPQASVLSLWVVNNLTHFVLQKPSTAPATTLPSLANYRSRSCKETFQSLTILQGGLRLSML